MPTAVSIAEARKKFKDLMTCLDFSQNGDGIGPLNAILGPAWTLGFWGKFRSNGGGTGGRIIDGNGNDRAFCTGTGAVQVQQQGATATSSNNYINYNRWRHYILAYDGANIYFVRDGGLFSQATIANAPFATAQDLTFFNRADDGLRYADGRFDEIVLYDRCLSEKERVQLYTGKLPDDDEDRQVYLKLDEGTGSIATDSSGNSNDLTINGGAYITDRPFGWTKDSKDLVENRFTLRNFGKSIEFNGTNAYITIPINPSLSGFSAAIWFNIPEQNAAERMLINWSNGYNAGGFHLSTKVGTALLNTLEFRIYRNGGSEASIKSRRYKFGTWNQAIITYVQNSAKLYLNSKLQSIDTNCNMAEPTSMPQLLTLGRFSNAASAWMKGFADEFVFKNGTPWTQQEIDDLYFKGKIPSSSICHLDGNDNILDLTDAMNDATGYNITYSTNVKMASPNRTQV